MSGAWEVFCRFLALGCISFGGPAAHIGYFQKTFVQQLHWLDEKSYARLVALSQFLPGPGSSQIGFALGYRRAGLIGGIAAFLGFTLPSFLLMYTLATGSSEASTSGVFSGIVRGLKLLAVVVVADAVTTMFSAFCRTRMAATAAVITATALLWFPSLWTQLLMLTLAAFLGAALGKSTPGSGRRVVQNRRDTTATIKKVPLYLFLILFAALPLLAGTTPSMNLFADFFQAGSLVFGGGHVVLPLLQQSIGEAVAADRFLLGYAAAQAVPGPMFSLAAFLGAELSPEHAFWGALTATAGIFLPGFLLVLGMQGAWETFAARPKVAGAAGGINAAVVGLLFAALYQPVFVSAVHSPVEMGCTLLGFFSLHALKVPVVALVIVFAAVGLSLEFM